jgi:acid phosphatase (class A)
MTRTLRPLAALRSSRAWPFLSTCAIVALWATLPIEASSGSTYLPPEADNFRSILDDPPAKGSEETRREIEIVLREQSRRTPADVVRIQAEADRMVVAFAEVLGPKLTASNLPLTFALIRNVGNDTGERIEESKRVWSRARPYEDDPRVKPSIALPTGSSYPAAIAVSARIYAVVLGELFPEKRSALLARGWLIGWDRVMAGVHYPSDVSAALKLGDYFAQRLLASPGFRADLEKARAECQRVFAQPVAPPYSRP